MLVGLPCTVKDKNAEFDIADSAFLSSFLSFSMQV